MVYPFICITCVDTPHTTPSYNGTGGGGDGDDEGDQSIVEETVGISGGALLLLCFICCCCYCCYTYRNRDTDSTIVKIVSYARS